MADDEGRNVESDEVTSALEQLQTDKKTPGFMKTLINHMFSVQKENSRPPLMLLKEREECVLQKMPVP